MTLTSAPRIVKTNFQFNEQRCISFLLDITVTNFVVLSMIIIVAILLLFQIHYSDQLLMIWICKDEEETGLVHYIRKF